MNIIIKRISLLLVCSMGLFSLLISCDKTEDELFESAEKNKDFEYKGTRNESRVYTLTVGYYYVKGLGDSIPISKPTADELVYMQQVIKSVVSRRYNIVMMPLAITNPVIMDISPLSDGVGYDISWMMNEIFMKVLEDGFEVFLQYKLTSRGSIHVSGSSGAGSSDRPYPGSSGDSDTGDSSWNSGTGDFQQPVLPDTCKNITDVMEFLVPLLDKNGMNLGETKIVDCTDEYQSPTKSALIWARDIQLCRRFYKKNLSDQYSILWHKIYNLQYDEYVVIRLQPLRPEVNLVLPDDVRAYLMTFLQDAYADLNASEREQKIDLDISNYLEMKFMYPPEYYLNEVNAYGAEIAINKDVSAIYHAEREFMYWLNKARYEVALNNYKL